MLVLGVGNPSRGDDALAPLLLERAAVELAPALARGELELLTDFQLQIEHALDLVGRTRVLFVDASVRAAAPFEVLRVTPARDASATTHALSPAAVLATHAAVAGQPPEAWLLAIRGERFELGEGLSDAARENLAAAVQHLAALVTGSTAWAAVGREVVGRP
ncbi:MAG: hydrogenase maturation protease [Polyangiaceae bacterium]|nr:hydrogenase maturation protease [Polyangiaceae bacterium]